MDVKTGYTFSKTRMILNIIAMFITGGFWILIWIPWELYRYVNAN